MKTKRSRLDAQPKQHITPDRLKVLAERNATALKNPAAMDGDFLYSPDAHFYVAELPNSPSFGDVPDSNLFVILAAGKSFETIVHSGVLGAKGGANDTTVHGLLSKGSYVLQVGVPTWPYRWVAIFQQRGGRSRAKETLD